MVYVMRRGVKFLISVLFAINVAHPTIVGNANNLLITKCEPSLIVLAMAEVEKPSPGLVTFECALKNLQKLKSDYARVVGLNVAKEEALLTLTSQFDQLKDSLNHCQEAIDSSSEVVHNQKKMIDDLKDLNKRLADKEKQTRESVAKMKKELQEKYKSEEEHFKKSLSEKDSELKKGQKKLAGVEKERDQMRQKSEALLRKVKEKFSEDCKKAEEKYQEKVEELGQRLRSTKAYYDSEVKSKEEKIKKLEEDIKTLQNRVKKDLSSHVPPPSTNARPKVASRKRMRTKKDSAVEFLEECMNPQKPSTSRRRRNIIDSDETPARFKKAKLKDDELELDSDLDADLVAVSVPEDKDEIKPRRVKLLKHPEIDETMEI